jgi:hypothetical protein
MRGKMDDQYKTIGAKYLAVKLKPSVAFTEVAAVKELLGDVAGRNVLDLACGFGFYTRLIKEGGAERVVGYPSGCGRMALTSVSAIAAWQVAR